MFRQILPLNLSSDEEIVTGLAFPLGPPTSVEPPKEKPPPPPVDVSDEENLPVEPLKRLNSTRRIKKELRTRRSDFLGIEGVRHLFLIFLALNYSRLRCIEIFSAKKCVRDLKIFFHDRNVDTFVSSHGFPPPSGRWLSLVSGSWCVSWPLAHPRFKRSYRGRYIV